MLRLRNTQIIIILICATFPHMGDSMLKICLCDDDQKEISSIKKIIVPKLDLTGMSYTINEFSSGESCLRSIKLRGERYDIIFLDIEMDALNGVETAKAIRAIDTLATIIFVTSYSEYVFDGYEVRAFHYVLKPYSSNKIVQVLMDAITEKGIQAEQVLKIDSGGKTYKIPWRDILYLQSDKRQIVVKTNQDIYEFYGKLDDLEKQLIGPFVRSHQRYIVNLQHALAVDSKSIQIPGEVLPVSKSKHPSVMIAFAKLMLD